MTRSVNVIDGRWHYKSACMALQVKRCPESQYKYYKRATSNYRSAYEHCLDQEPDTDAIGSYGYT